MSNMSNTNTDFKQGDYVFYAGDELTTPDHGVVKSIDFERVWVKWDSDGNTLWVHPEEIVLVDRESDCQNTQNTQNATNELTMEKCIKFLSSKGYCITLSKK